MMRCDPRAYARCPDHQICGSVLGDAVFVEGSECDKFNQQVLSQPLTNADRIRAMSDEELAAIIMCPYDSGPELCNRSGNCLTCCIEWLQQPAED